MLIHLTFTLSDPCSEIQPFYISVANKVFGTIVTQLFILSQVQVLSFLAIQAFVIDIENIPKSRNAIGKNKLHCHSRYTIPQLGRRAPRRRLPQPHPLTICSCMKRPYQNHTYQLKFSQRFTNCNLGEVVNHISPFWYQNPPQQIEQRSIVTQIAPKKNYRKQEKSYFYYLNKKYDSFLRGYLVIDLFLNSTEGEISYKDNQSKIKNQVSCDNENVEDQRSTIADEVFAKISCSYGIKIVSFFISLYGMYSPSFNSHIKAENQYQIRGNDPVEPDIKRRVILQYRLQIPLILPSQNRTGLRSSSKCSRQEANWIKHELVLFF